MAIEYAGQSLLLETDELRDWMRRHGGFDELRHLCPWHEVDPKINYHGDLTSYYRPPINRLYWPTGAQRWSIFYGLAERERKEKIVTAAKAATPQGSGWLELTFGDVTIRPRMYLLPPRPLTCKHGGNELWLIPLVDARYWWQFRDTGDMDIDTQTTWALLFSTLATQVGETFTLAAAVDSDYLVPDHEAIRDYARPAPLIDAAAWSCGMRFVSHIEADDTEQTYRLIHFAESLINFTDSGSTLTANLAADNWHRIAGDEFAAEPYDAAETVRVAFRKIRNGIRDPDGSYNTKDNTPSATDFPADRLVDDSVLTVHTTCYADHTTNGFAGAADNDADLASLAAQIAADYYASRLRRYDYLFAGLKTWDAVGYDNYTEWSIGSFEGGEPRRSHKAATRVVTAPPNLSVASMLHRDTDAAIVDAPLVKRACIVTSMGGTTFTANDGEWLDVDARVGNATVNLPASPSHQDHIRVQIMAIDDANKCTVKWNGNPINGETVDVILLLVGEWVEFVYDGKEFMTWEMLDGRIPTGAEMRLDGSQSTIIADAFTVVQHDTEVWDRGGLATTGATAHFTIRRPNVYRVYHYFPNDDGDAGEALTFVGLNVVGAATEDELCIPGGWGGGGGGGGGGLTVTAKSGAYTAADGDLVVATGSSSYSITLPASPTADDRIGVFLKSVTGTNTVTVARNGKNINGAAADVVLYVANDYVEVKYDGTEWWIVEDGRIPHACKLTRTANQTGIVKLTVTQVQLNVSSFDNAGLGNTGTYKITFRRAGMYVVSCMTVILNLVNGKRQFAIIDENAGTYIQDGIGIPIGANAVRTNSYALGMFEFSAGDTLQLDVYHDDTANRDLEGGLLYFAPFLAVTEILNV